MVRTSSDREGLSLLFTRLLSDDHLIVPDASCIPLRIKDGERVRKKEGALGDLFAQAHGEGDTIANLSPAARGYLTALEERAALGVPAR